jgi:hypothetical protein
MQAGTYNIAHMTRIEHEKTCNVPFPVCRDWPRMRPAAVPLLMSMIMFMLPVIKVQPRLHHKQPSHPFARVCYIGKLTRRKIVSIIETTSASRPSQNDTKKTISTETDVRQIMNCYLLWSPFVCLMLSWGWWSPLTHLSPPPLYIQNHTSITNLFPHHCYLSLCSLFLSVPLHERNPGEYQ